MQKRSFKLRFILKQNIVLFLLILFAFLFNFAYSHTSLIGQSTLVCLGQETELSLTDITVQSTYKAYYDIFEDGTIDVTATIAQANFRVRYRFPNSGTFRVRATVKDTTGTFEESVTFEVNVLPVPDIRILTPDTSICEHSSLRLRSVSTLESIAYQWTPASLLDDPSIANPNVLVDQLPIGVTVFTLLVRHPNFSCSNSASVRVTVLEAPVIDAGPDRTTCQTEQVQLLASATNPLILSFQWEPSSSVDNPTILQPRTRIGRTTVFTLTATNRIGCKTVDSVRVTVLSVDAGPDSVLICEGTTVTLEAKFPPGANNCTLRWNGISPDEIRGGSVNSASVTIRPSAAKRCYTVTASCAGCNSSDGICVIQTTLKNIQISPDTSVCNGDSVQLFASGGITYVWSPKSSLSNPFIPNPKASPKTTTTYTVTVLDDAGCKGEAEVTVVWKPLPFIDLPKDTVYCSGDTMRLTAGEASTSLSYQWSPNIDLLPGSLNAPKALIVPQQSRQYNVTMQNNTNGCIRRDTINIEFIEKPNAATVTGKDTICLGEGAFWEAQGAERYLWLGLRPPIVTDKVYLKPESTNTYTVIPFNQSCRGKEIIKTLTVAPFADGEIIAPSQACHNASFQVRLNADLSAIKKVTWNWGNAQAKLANGEDPRIGPYEVTTFLGRNLVITATITTGDSCNRIISKTISLLPTPEIDAGPPILFACKDKAIQLQAKLKFDALNPCFIEWSPSIGLSNPYILNPIAILTQSQKYKLKIRCAHCESNEDSVEVIVEDKPIIILDSAYYSICAGTSVQLKSRVLQPNPSNLKYTWTPALGLNDRFAAEPVANPNQTTEYKLIASNQNGCSTDSIRVIVQVNPLPKVRLNSDEKICQGSGKGVWLDGEILNPENHFGKFKYEWKPSSGVKAPYLKRTYAQPDTTTIYTLIVQDEITGCKSDSTTLDDDSKLIVEVIPTPKADAGPDSISICKGESITIGGRASGGTGNYIYEWSPETDLDSPDVAFPKASPSTSRTYWLKVTANGCTSNADSIYVKVFEKPKFSAYGVYDLCLGDSLKLNFNSEFIDSTLIITWSPPTGLNNPNIPGPKASPSQTTLYKVTVEAKGCTESHTDSALVRVIPSAQVKANPDNIVMAVCANDFDSLTIPAKLTYTFEPVFLKWQPSDGLSSISQLNPKVLPRQTTTYTITVENGGCIAKDSVTVFVFPVAKFKLSSPTQKPICAGDSILVFIEGYKDGIEWQWKWSPEADYLIKDTLIVKDTLKLKVFPDLSGYFVLNANSSGCITSDSLFFEIIPIPLVDFEAEVIKDCSNSTIRFSDKSTHAQFWRWEFGDNSPITNLQHPLHTYTDTGSFNVKLTVWNSNGCRDSLMIERLVRIYPPVQAFGTSSPIAPVRLYLPNATVAFQDSSQNGAIQWVWRFGDGHYSTARNPIHEYLTPGSYHVELTVYDSAQCVSHATLGPFEVLAPQLHIPTAFSPNNDGLNDEWLIFYYGSEAVKIQIFNRFGNVVFETNDHRKRWDGANAPVGTYMYKILVGNKEYFGTIQLIK